MGVFVPQRLLLPPVYFRVLLVLACVGLGGHRAEPQAVCPRARPAQPTARGSTLLPSLPLP